MARIRGRTFSQHGRVYAQLESQLCTPCNIWLRLKRAACACNVLSMIVVLINVCVDPLLCLGLNTYTTAPTLGWSFISAVADPAVPPDIRGACVATTIAKQVERPIRRPVALGHPHDTRPSA